MKYVKMLGLAAIAAAALMAFVGAGTAAASNLCTAGTTTAPCGSGHAPYSGTISASSTSAVLTGGSFEVTCKESTASGTANASAEGSITSLTFGNCSGSCTEATAVHLSYKAVGDTATQTMAVTSNGNGNPGAELKHCTVFNVSCTYSSEKVTLGFESGAPSKLVASKEPLTRSAGSSLCPSEGSWTATYTETAPGTGLWLE